MDTIWIVALIALFVVAAVTVFARRKRSKPTYTGGGRTGGGEDNPRGPDRSGPAQM